MEADSNSPSAEGSAVTGVETTATYSGQVFHLFQVVEIRPRPLPGEWPRRWMVISLGGGVTVATVEFTEVRHYDADSGKLSDLTPVTKDGTPVYGY